MFVLITGGGRTGTQLANLLINHNHKVQGCGKHRKEVLSRIHRELPTEVIHEGSATDPQILEQAGIRKAQVVASLFIQ